MSGAWWDLTRNPVVGCSPAGEDCDNCWARRFAMRQTKREGPTGDAYRDVVKNCRWTGETRFLESALKRVPGKDKVVFVSSMGDLWHETTHTSWIAAVLAWAEGQRQHTFVNCTKRPKRAAEWPGFVGPFPPNWVQLVSAGNQETFNKRLPHLLDIRTKIRGLHIEPLFGPVDLERAFVVYSTGEPWGPRCNPDGSSAISWVVVGGETGPGARPCDPAWVRSIVDQCREAGVPLWVKQAPHPFETWRQKPAGMP